MKWDNKNWIRKQGKHTKILQILRRVFHCQLSSVTFAQVTYVKWRLTTTCYWRQIKPTVIFLLCDWSHLGGTVFCDEGWFANRSFFNPPLLPKSFNDQPVVHTKFWDYFLSDKIKLKISIFFHNLNYPKTRVTS